MIGVDLSEYQSPGTGLWADFAIIRAANGRRYDTQWSGHVDAWRRAGKPFSLYIYCEPGSTNPEYQGDLICTVAGQAGVGQATKLYADIEEGGGDLRWFEDRILGRINAHGWPGDTYSGDYFFGAHNLVGRGDAWKAAYGSNDGRPHTPPHQPWAIWQYTSNPIDTNTADAAVIARIFGGASAPAPAPPRPNPGVRGMLFRDASTGSIYLVGPGHAHAIHDPNEVSRLEFVGVPLVEQANGLDIVAWGRDFGVPNWWEAATWE